MSISDLTPNIVWKYFDEITKIPRPSKKEEKILSYLVTFAIQNNLTYRQDKIGNIVIYKARQNSVSQETIILQSHVDMVCEKDSNIAFNFDTDPISTYIDGNWVKAKGTTLGADCGIGMAIELAVLADKNISHPNIEALFTVDEETGLTGAFGLDKDMLKGRYLINLDSEDEGEIFIGCAGGIDTVASFDIGYDKIADGMLIRKISIKGLQGGHSGDDINKCRANANILLSRILLPIMERYDIKIAHIDGGNLRNAIPREAIAVIGIPIIHQKAVLEIIEVLSQQIKTEYHETEPDMSIEISESETLHTLCFDSECAFGIIKSMFSVVNGVVAMSQDIDDFVETSTNLASVKIVGDKIIISTSQRSSVDSKKEYISKAVEMVFLSYGATVVHSDGYPGWTPIPTSHLLDVFKECYVALFNSEAKVKAIHAGLECGLFLEKYPHLEMISIGPTLRHVHSPSEMLDIESVKKVWDLLILSLKTV